jgi:hypothetical protein
MRPSDCRGQYSDFVVAREEFGRYLLRELLWELEKFDETVP